ncbi:MAG: terminase family protein [Parvibaculaceae bacterium]|nr:terminase family protein [Parvibaculaceae bacterium]
MSLDLTLSAPQNVFLNGLNTKYRAYVGGFGSGKTFVGCLDLALFAGRHPGLVQGYFGPTYPAIRDIFYPTFDEAAWSLGFRTSIKYTDKEVALYRGAAYYGTIICRSMEKPNTIVGFKIARALVDEIDTLPKDKAALAWNKIVARLRLVVPGVVNGIGVTTTPEGFLFVYERFAVDPQPSYSMVQASTYENAAYLPPDYIDSLLETYPDELIRAYLDGDFVNLTSGSVYRSFSRQKNHSDEVIAEGEPLLIGMDFNVGKMAACVNVRRGQNFHCVGEIVGGLDTPSVIETIKAEHPDHDVTVYPDASGGNTSSKGASVSDIALLREAGFSVLAKASNPRVKDRVLSVNKAFETGRWFVNTHLCKETTKCLEQQSYDKNGQPDKKSGVDHQNDAFGYPVAYEIPILRPSSNVRFNL